MKNCFSFLALLAIACMSIWLGFQAERGFDHGWLYAALAALFAASEARYWRPAQAGP